MATVIRRTLRSTPHRTASETWQLLIGLIAPDKSSASRTELDGVAGIVAQLIASESLKDSPLVVYGDGPRVRFYCLFDEDAITGDDANEDSLAFVPTAKDWRISIPCHDDDLAWAEAQLRSRSSRIGVRGVGEDIEEAAPASRITTVEIDMTAFLRK